MWKLLACLALLLAVVSAQFTVRTTSQIIDVGLTSDPIYVETLTTIPNKTITINIRAFDAVTGDAASGVSIENQDLTFQPDVQSLYFRVSSTVVGSFFLNFTKTDDDGQFADIPDFNYVFRNRTFSFFQFSSPLSLVAQLPSEPLTVFVSTAPTSNLVLTPVCDDTTISFPNGDITIAAGTKSSTFVVVGLNTGNFAANVSFNVNGDSSNYYDRDSIGIPRPFTFQIAPRQLTIRPADVDIQLGSVNSTGISIFTRDVANSSFTVTPKAAGVTFTPSSATFTPTQPSAFFTFTTDLMEVQSTDRVVNFYSSGSDRPLYTLNIPATTFSAPKRIVRTILGGQNVVTNRTYMSLSIRAPVVSSLVVTFTASNIKFNVSSVEFKNNITAFTVEVHNQALGSDNVYFALSGNDAKYFTDIAPLTVSPVTRGNFIGPADWYNPILFVGQESDKIPIRASISPRSSVTLTPVASNVIFRPASLTFRNGTEQQYFTITPLYNSQSDSFTTSVSWFINGTDHAMFSLPSAFTVQVYQRYFQAQASAHLQTAEIDGQNIATTRHLHKTYRIWTSVNYIGNREHFSVTPTSPYYSFKPAVLFFNNKNTRILLEATVTGVPPGGNGRIDYIYGGQDGGLYTPATPDTTGIALRPLEIVAAVVAPDERSKGVYLVRNITGPSAAQYDPVSAGVLTNYHVQSFKLRSFVLPDKKLTITPHCAHATFSPKSITIKGDDGVKQQDYWPTVQGYEYVQDCNGGTCCNGNVVGATCTNVGRVKVYQFNVTGVYLEANFSVTAQAAGVHPVWFELSGDDKDYYERVPHTWMNFNLVMRPKSEPYRVSSSSYLLPSFVVVAAMAVLSLVM